jgi:AraC-like DNA-binding protein
VPKKFQFSTKALPTTLDDRARLQAWDRFLTNFYAALRMDGLPDAPFHAQFEGAAIGQFHIGRVRGSISRFERTMAQVAAQMSDDYVIALNLGGATLKYRQVAREIDVEPGVGMFCTNSEPGEVLATQNNAWLFLGMPRALIHQIHPGAEDLLGQALDARNPGLRHLHRYLDMLLTAEDLPEDPALVQHVDMTLSDIIAVALGGEREMAHITRVGGARAGHLRDVLREIKTGFGRSDFSPDDLCRKLTISPRYLQALLAETGTTFSERVTELRLLKARSLLGAASHRHRKISEIAYECGFGDVSYFNRRFKARFGTSPTEFRHERSTPKD